MTATPLSVGIIGFGRSGRDIHAATLKRLPERFKISAVCDPLAERAAEARTELNCATYENVGTMLGHPDLDLVVVASPNYLHALHAKAFLQAGKHVLCEKPVGFTTREVDELIAAAAASGKILQAFQQRRFEADFCKLKEICDSGLLGKISFVRIAWHGFSRRWDWQTSRAFGGGQLYNNGPHLVDHALQLFGPSDPDVWCNTRRSLASGDAEDEFHVILSGPGAPTVQAEILSTAAYPQDRWYVTGTAGSLHGNVKRLDWKWVDWRKLPERPLDVRPTAGRTYNGEPLEWQEDSWTAVEAADSGAGSAPASQPSLALYDDLWKAIREKKPQTIPPQATRRLISVLEKCYLQNGIPFPTANDPSLA